MIRKTQLILALAAFLLGIGAAAWALQRRAASASVEDITTARVSQAAAGESTSATASASSLPAPPVPSPEDTPRMGSDEELYAMFSADPSGRLVLNPTTRLNIEKLHALNSHDDLLLKAGKLSKALPPVAHSELLKLTSSYVQYIDALQEAFPPEAEVNTVSEAEAELKGIHELRLKHFGPEVTESFFGEEERMSRRLISLMALEADEKMPLAEKAHRAQLLLQSGKDPAASGAPAP